MVRYPAPLKPGDHIGVTAPSSGVDAPLLPRFEACLAALRDRGYDVVVGRCVDGASHVSATKEERAHELMGMLTDPDIRAVFPPWGGETAIDLLDVLDWDALAAVDPTWVIGFSDTTTWMLPLTLRLDWATVHGAMLMDEPYRQPDGLARWSDLASATGPVTQRGLGAAPHGRLRGPGRRPRPGRVHPRRARDLVHTGARAGRRHRPAGGRLHRDGLQPRRNAVRRPPRGGRTDGTRALLVYLEACGDDAFTICRNLHGLRLAGWFDRARAVIIGRTPAPDCDTLTQHEAVADALGGLGVPVVARRRVRPRRPPDAPGQRGAGPAGRRR